ncbi:hypothetical protein H257_02164 [Aphanomyces astaci]|uniref:Uncharacterized protein n=1 Tax=Aphanomyces astaci TaxID=112090 RepID=W4H7C4_APHAT|nr:hypothetical protein H257_02164 [Aphanomyces astaci]ETV87189.1 hypothetical protein H257_02164 [Aphanomyces astaci]|eukprot:XP_009823988.1 hypothetical protein H257_02164 [Aphanomyces astaci]
MVRGRRGLRRSPRRRRRRCGRGRRRWRCGPVVSPMRLAVVQLLADQDSKVCEAHSTLLGVASAIHDRARSRERSRHGTSQATISKCQGASSSPRVSEGSYL